MCIVASGAAWSIFGDSYEASSPGTETGGIGVELLGACASCACVLSALCMSCGRSPAQHPQLNAHHKRRHTAMTIPWLLTLHSLPRILDLLHQANCGLHRHMRELLLVPALQDVLLMLG